MCVCVCVCVCVCGRERKSVTDRQADRERQTDRQTERKTQKERNRESTTYASASPLKITLGGVPVSVAMPSMLAEKAVERANTFASP